MTRLFDPAQPSESELNVSKTIEMVENVSGSFRGKEIEDYGKW